MKPFILTLTLLASVADAALNWPQFRGPGARGIADSPKIPDTWSATENVAWKTDLPGRGWSSPIVWGNRVFLTSVINKGKLEAPKKGLYFGGNRKAPTSRHEYWVYCLNLKSGEVNWKRRVHSGVPQTGIHVKGSFGAETAVTDGEHVYFYFGDQGIFAFTLDGDPVWQKRQRARKTRFGWGTASSPILHEDRIYLVNDNEEDSYLVALNKRDGKQIWQTERREGSNWSTPCIWRNSQRTEIIVPGSGHTASYDLAGKMLWHWKQGMSSITIATPYADGDRLFISSGYVGSNLKPIYSVRPGAKGDISLDRSESRNEFITWCNWNAAPYNPSTLLYRDRLYVLLDRGLVSALDPKTGNYIYNRERLTQRGAFTTSPWANNGKIFCLDENGVTFVIAAGDQFKLLNRNRLAADDMCMATPALAGNNLLIRTAARLYCIRKEE